MRIAAHFRRVCCPPLILVALAFLATPSLAVNMQVTVGFDGVGKTSAWTPIAVRLVNSADENVEAVLLIRDPDNSADSMPVCTAQVNLPARSTKLYHAYIRPGGYGGKLDVTLARGYGVLAFKSVNVNSASPEDRLIVTVGDRSARLSFMQGETIQVMPHPPAYSGSSSGLTQATIHAGSVSPAALPDRPAAYEGVDVMILSGLAPDSTNPNALKAICAWVASGGTLVVPTGPDYRAFTNAFYDELLPVKLQGAASLPGMGGLTSLGNVPFPAGPAAIAKSALKPGIGKPVLSQSGALIIAERSYGAGRVIFLAFDLRSSPFKDWNGQTQFWKSLIKDSTGEPLVQATGQFFSNRYPGQYYPDDGSQWGGLMGTVTQNPSIKTPSTNTIGLFLLCYLTVLVPVNYFVLRRKRRLELAWISTPIIVLVFAFGAYAIGYTMKGGNLRLCEATVIESSANARYARAVTEASVFSPARRSYNFSVSDPSAISQMVAMGRNEDLPTTYLGDTSIIEGVSMAMWSSKTFESVGGMDLGGAIEANLKQDGGKIVGSIKNNTSVDLGSCEVVFGNANLGIGALPKGVTRQVSLPVGRKAGHHGPSYPDPEAPLRLRLMKFARSKAAACGTPVLIALAKSGGAVFDMPDNRPVAERSVCCVFRLGYEAGSAITISPAMVSVQSSNLGQMRPQANTGILIGSLYGGAVTGTYRLPLPSGFKVTSLSLVGSVRPTGVKRSITIYNAATGKWDAVTIPSGKSLPNPASYVSADSRVQIKFAAPSGPVTVTCGVSAEARRQ